jgi:hypothetical protein
MEDEKYKYDFKYIKRKFPVGDNVTGIESQNLYLSKNELNAKLMAP